MNAPEGTEMPVANAKPWSADKWYAEWAKSEKARNEQFEILRKLRADVKPLVDALIHICSKPELRPASWLVEAIEVFKTKHPDCCTK